MRIETPWFEVDASVAPLVVTHLHDLSSTEAVRRLGAAYTAVLSQGYRQFFITDIGRPPRYETAIRHAIAEMVRHLEPLERQWSAGAVIVVRSPFTRATMTAIRWISRPVVPETYVATLHEAAAVAEERMLLDGLQVDGAVASALRAIRTRD